MSTSDDVWLGHLHRHLVLEVLHWHLVLVVVLGRRLVVLALLASNAVTRLGSDQVTLGAFALGVVGSEDWTLTVTCDLGAGTLEVAVVVVGLSVDSTGWVDGSETVLALVRVRIGTDSVGVLLTLIGSLTGTETLVLVVLAVGSTNRNVQVGTKTTGIGGVWLDWTVSEVNKLLFGTS